MQVKLNVDQIEAFYHNEFVASQVRNFYTLLGHRGVNNDIIVDVGGGVGFFSYALRSSNPNARIRVIDTDAKSIELAQGRGLEAIQGDALQPPIVGDEGIVCFNLILHHLIAPTEEGTVELQSKALLAWKGHVKWVFIDEYIYDSYVGSLSGQLIYFITRSKLLSRIGRIVSRFIPSLNANTFGVGVRFRSQQEWCDLFSKLGFEVVDTVRGPEEHVSLPRRLLLIQSCRRDSFLLGSAA